MADNTNNSCCDSSSCCGISLFGRALSLSFTIPVLILAVVATVALSAGWSVGGHLLVGNESEATAASDGNLKAIVDAKTNSAPSGQWADEFEKDGHQPPWNGVLYHLEPQRGTLSGVYMELIDPVHTMFDSDSSRPMLALYAIGGLWTLLVYALFGGAISRIAVVQLGRGERVGMMDAIKYSLGKIRSYFMAPLFVIVATVLLALLVFVPGLIMKLDIGMALVSLGWIIVMILATAMTVLLLVLAVGWPLMWGTISAEETGDVFEATSRSFSYTLQQPLKYAIYVVMAFIIGGLGWWLIDLVSSTVVDMSLWSASWGAGAERVDLIDRVINDKPLTEDLSSPLNFGVTIIALLSSVVLYLPVAFAFGYFFAAYGAIYLLLRKDADQTELDEVFIEAVDAHFELPQLTAPPAGEAAEDAESAQQNDTQETDSEDSQSDQSGEQSADESEEESGESGE